MVELYVYSDTEYPCRKRKEVREEGKWEGKEIETEAEKKTEPRW